MKHLKSYQIFESFASGEWSQSVLTDEVWNDIMLGVIYYQHRLMEERLAFWQAQYEKKDSEINSIVKEEKSILMDRIVYLQEQRDKYVEKSLEEEEEKEN